MRFSEAFEAVSDWAAPPEEFGDLRRNIDPEWVEQALEATGTATLRRRRLPAEQVIWLVIGMALYRNRSIWDVVSKLDLALPGPSPTVVRSTVSSARARLGDEPMEWLFMHSAETWARRSADAHRWRGLALYGVDGTTLRVPDSDDNRSAFGGADGARGESGYPIVRMAALMVLHSHLVAATSFGPYDTGEVTYASDLWAKVLPRSLIIVDRGFFGASLLLGLQAVEGRHWLTRGKADLKYRVVRKLGKDDAIVEMDVSKAARTKDPNLPATWTARRITYQRKGFQPQVLLTSLTDPESYPVDEIVELYHQRWEIELGYDEIKTHMLGREETIRSKSPAGVRQEIWGLLLAYNLIRVEMERVAQQARVEPTRISFVGAMRLIVDEWSWCAIASPGAIPRHLTNLRLALVGLVLPERRQRPAYPRAVKMKMSKFARKRPVARRGRA